MTRKPPRLHRSELAVPGSTLEVIAAKADGGARELRRRKGGRATDTGGLD